MNKERVFYGRSKILHKETETLLEILLYNCSIKPGVYVNKGYSNEWLLSE